ncbi:hypothetical protein E2562_006074 [Oryza meyeriana var. granulata]|uniref:Uncharacterized protein n=1 Tax=Oryza meyeriana var. granulata TaxID=110450 RepID=A0A6G1EVH3_9ORYZ|nr:hypothetical protein E2562_006074 [Oryza meyeriana var. granulata]
MSETVLVLAREGEIGGAVHDDLAFCLRRPPPPLRRRAPRRGDERGVRADLRLRAGATTTSLHLEAEARRGAADGVRRSMQSVCLAPAIPNGKKGGGKKRLG